MDDDSILQAGDVAAVLEGAAVVAPSASLTAAREGGALAGRDGGRRRLGHVLDRVLSSLALLALKTRTAVWSIVAPELWALRDALDDQHAGLELHVDAIAERMRHLGTFPGGSSDGWQELSAAGEQTLDGNDAPLDVVDDLLADQDRALCATLAARERAAGEDEATTALLAAVAHDLSRMTWTLRSLTAALFEAAPVEITFEQVA